MGKIITNNKETKVNLETQNMKKRSIENLKDYMFTMWYTLDIKQQDNSLYPWIIITNNKTWEVRATQSISEYTILKAQEKEMDLFIDNYWLISVPWK